MPRMPTSSREILAYTIKENRPVLGEILAAVIGHGPRSEKAESDRRLFWTPALTLEDEMALVASGADPYEVSRQTWPWRWDALDKDGRDTLKKQAVWVARMTKLGPPDDLIRKPIAPDLMAPVDPLMGAAMPPTPMPTAPQPAPTSQTMPLAVPPTPVGIGAL